MPMNVFNRSTVHRLCLCLAAAVLAACEPGPEPGGLEFVDTWVRAAPPETQMTAAFGVLENQTASDLEISAWSSPAYADVSLHSTELVDGISKMREVPVLVIPAGDSVALAPGGYHLMLMMPLRDVKSGESVVLHATTLDGRNYRFEAPVEAR
ncbi:MAG: copper chaperone PCu(A)C [Xanthomonadales bacterium]|nr:copper chaperone PCu(A)C [Xanthomonadales bacterium]